MAATISTGPAGQGGGGTGGFPYPGRGPFTQVQPGVDTPWWQVPPRTGPDPNTTLQNLVNSAPAGYTYDAVQRNYVPIVGSAADRLAQRTRFEGMLFGGGGGGATVPYPNAPTAREPNFTAPAATTAAQIPTIEAPDTSAAQAAIFARAKDKVGAETSGSLASLRSALAGRGLLGGGAEVKGTSNILTGGQAQLGDTTREQAVQEAQRQNDFAKLGYQGKIEQRGQDITTNEGAANRALAAAQTNYQGDINQRGQDISQNEAQYTGGITQRGQDITARGQTLGALSNLIAKLY